MARGARQRLLSIWTTEELSNVLTKVFDRLQKVLCLIVEGRGKNDLVETKRGKKVGAMNLRSDEELVCIMTKFKEELENLDESGEVDELIDEVLEEEDIM